MKIFVHLQFDLRIIPILWTDEFITFNIWWWYIAYSACSYKTREFNLTVPRNLSEKEDELLQWSRWLQQSQANSTDLKGKKSNFSLFILDTGKERRGKIQLILHFAASVMIYDIYLGYKVLLCVLDLNDKWLFTAAKSLAAQNC